MNPVFGNGMTDGENTNEVLTFNRVVTHQSYKDVSMKKINTRSLPLLDAKGSETLTNIDRGYYHATISF